MTTNILIDTPTKPNATASALEYMIKRVKFLEQENESLKRAVGEDSKHVEGGAGTKGSKKIGISNSCDNIFKEESYTKNKKWHLSKKY